MLFCLAAWVLFKTAPQNDPHSCHPRGNLAGLFPLPVHHAPALENPSNRHGGLFMYIEQQRRLIEAHIKGTGYERWIREPKYLKITWPGSEA